MEEGAALCGTHDGAEPQPVPHDQSEPNIATTLMKSSLTGAQLPRSREGETQDGTRPMGIAQSLMF